MNDLKGSSSRVIDVPGYHVKSKHDLKFLRERRQKSGQRSFDIELPLTSLIDMFSTLVIFLILNYSTTGEVFFINHDVKLPKAEHGVTLKSLPLVSITSREVLFESQYVGDHPLRIGRQDELIPKLKEMLVRARELEERTNPEKPFRGAVNIQADQSLPIIYVKRVMNTLISAGWSEINFAVSKEEEK